MSGKGPDKPGPIALTQDEVDRLIAGKRSAGVSKRLKRIVKPARAAARVRNTKPSPPALKRAELTAIRAGRMSAAVRKRLFPEMREPSDAAPPMAKDYAGKPYPTEPPRRKSR